MFIVLEGIDGCGKSYSARELEKTLTEDGNEILLTYEPTGDTPIGVAIRNIMADGVEISARALAHLFVADRIGHVEDTIKPALSEGKTVLCERYTYSTIAYQQAQGVDRNWLIHLNKGFPKPDLAFFIDIDPDTSMDKIRVKLRENEEKLKDRIELGEEQAIHEYRHFKEFEKPRCFGGEKNYKKFLEKVRKAYLQFGDELVHVDSNREIGCVIGDILEKIRDKK